MYIEACVSKPFLRGSSESDLPKHKFEALIYTLAKITYHLTRKSYPESINDFYSACRGLKYTKTSRKYWVFICWAQNPINTGSPLGKDLNLIALTQELKPFKVSTVITSLLKLG